MPDEFEEGGRLETRRVTSADWPLVERLFGRNGACGGCWCQYWQVAGGSAWEANKGEPNRQALRASILEGRCIAILALVDGEPAGWCRFGPRDAFPKLARSRKLHSANPAPWVVLCFFVERRHRGRRIAIELLRTATREAVASGAAAIEGYPVMPKDRRIASAFAWTGVPQIFQDAGYSAVDAEAGSRRIYRFTANEG